MAVSVKVSGGKAWKKALNPYVENENPGVVVGALEGATYAMGPLAGELVAANLARHEFGTEHIPARAPMRSTLAKMKGEWVKTLIALLKANPGKIQDMFNATGMRMAKDIQQSFEDGLEPPLKEETVERKRTMGKDGKKLGKVKRGKRKGEQKTGPYAVHADKPIMLTGETQKSIEYEWIEDLRTIK